MQSRRLQWILLGLSVGIGLAADVQAQNHPGPNQRAPVLEADAPAWSVRPEIDIPVLAIEAALTLPWLLNHQLEPAHCAPVCNPDALWAIDRFSAGFWRPTWSLASDVGAATIIGSAFLAVIVDQGLSEAWVDLLVVVESIGATAALTSVTTLAVRRPRPFVYGTEA
ncbi:MAG: hypothetical protein KC416_16250, partial [Myxococcales bacterium]|nr:hypothetical protein [Myxococcales bacterium]